MFGYGVGAHAKGRKVCWERGRVRSLAIPGDGRRIPRAERAAVLTAGQSMRLDGSERFPPSLPGRCLVVVLDRSLDTTGWYGCGSWRRADVFDFLHLYFSAAVSEMPDHKSSPNARVNQPISNGLSWLMGVTGTQSSAVSGVPRTSP